ncbi:helix-turn-helix domain-containing protein [Salinithrix halophila]|uniref:Helix-turn-helix domain-containing protein n=1 Tax=Salinithrix halophila TaxID=1485204 RepID=A0ABV8JHE0_9BACL
MLSQLVRRRMKDNNITFQMLAERTGYSASYLNNIVCGHRRWNIDTMQKVCSALEIKWNPFTGGENGENIQAG